MDRVTGHLSRWPALATVLLWVGACGSTSIPGEVDGGVSRECAGGCVIDGACVAAGTTAPDNPCLACEPASATTRTVRAMARAATTGPSARSRTRAETACVVVAHAAATTDIACNGTATCSEADDACLTGASSCAGQRSLRRAERQLSRQLHGLRRRRRLLRRRPDQPGQPCEVCAVASSRSAWSANQGARCDDGLFCTDGDVCHGQAVQWQRPRLQR
jgi:hypothetical protein